jgi:hypothetical protein
MDKIFQMVKSRDVSFLQHHPIALAQMPYFCSVKYMHLENASHLYQTFSVPTDINSLKVIYWYHNPSSSISSASLGLHSIGNTGTAKMPSTTPPCCRSFLLLGGSCHRDIFLLPLSGQGRAQHGPRHTITLSQYQKGRYPLS